MKIYLVPVIIALTYGIVEILKSCVKSKNFNNFIPLVAGGLGIIFGIIAYLIPNFMQVNNLLEAMLAGLVSGLSATGSNQIYKQMKELSYNKMK